FERVVVAVPVGVRALAEHLGVAFVREGRVVERMAGAEALAAYDVDGHQSRGGRPARRRDSSRVRTSLRTAPSSADVTAVDPGFSMPRSAMHMCSASTMTPTPFGSSCSWSQFAICCVR